MFNEAEWMRLLFLISDTQAWIREMERDVLNEVRVPGRLLKNTYYLSASSLTHILERHYYKISRYPNCGKFTVDIPTIVHWIREAFPCEQSPIPGSLNFKRCMDTKVEIGFDKEGKATTFITVVTEPAGEIKTAFPGYY